MSHYATDALKAERQQKINVQKQNITEQLRNIDAEIECVGEKRLELDYKIHYLFSERLRKENELNKIK